MHTGLDNKNKSYIRVSKSTSGWINVTYVGLTLYVLVLCFTLDLIYVSSQKYTSPKFRVDNHTSLVNKNNSVFESYIISQPELSAHSASIEVIDHNKLLAFWFAGSHEGKADVKIWSAEFINNHWSEARAVISPQMLSDGLFQFVHKVGNPVVYKDVHGVLHLFIVSVGAIGGWSGSNIDHFMSDDDGKTWKNPQKLILTPLFNISTLVRTRAIPLHDGGFYLPVYDELIYTYPEILRFDSRGNFIQKIRLSSQRDLLQPAVVADNLTTAYAFLRNKGWRDTILYMQSGKSGGMSWSIPHPTNLSNRDSSIAVIRLSDGKLLMVHNPLDRGKLILSISSDGVNWSYVATIENREGMEYSYPAIAYHDGLIDVLYTYERQKIKHVRFNEAWLDRQTAISIKR